MSSKTAGAPGLERIEHADHRGQHLIVDHDRFRRGARMLQRIGDDEGDTSPTKRTLPCASIGNGGSFIGRPSLTRDAPAAGQPAEAVGLESSPVSTATRPAAPARRRVDAA